MNLNNHRTKPCNGCVYLGYIGDTMGCNYIFIKDKRRPCPPGKDCTVKEKKSRLNGKDLTINGKTMCVADWSKRTGISKDTIYAWYAKLGRELTEKKVLAVWEGRK